MSRVGGRTADPAWAEVKKSDDGKTAICNHCGVDISCKVERVRSHLSKCSKKYQEKFSNDEVLSVVTNVSDAGIDSSMKILKKRKVGISSYVVSTSLAQKEIFDKKVAKFFYANNIPFNVASNSCTKDMFNEFRAGYEAPNRKQLSGTLLDKVHDDIESEFKKKTKDESATLSMDGWSSIKNDPIIASSIQIQGKTHLIAAEDASSRKKTAKFCVEVAKKAIEDLQKQYEIEVFALVTDNENKMKKMKNLLAEQYPDILTYGCSAHWVNLIEKAVTPKSELKNIVEVHKYFRNNHQAHGWLKRRI